MKIIQVITELTPAGAERVLANLSIALKNKGYDVIVVSLKPIPENRTIVDELFKCNIPILSLNLTKLSPWRIFKFKRIFRFIEHQQSTNSEIIVHSHLIHANLVCRLSKILGCRFKLINTIHISEKRQNRFWYFWLDKLTLKYCNQLTAVSQAAAEFNCLKLNIPHYRIKVIPNGISPPKTISDSEIKELRKEWKLEDCSKIIGSVGRLDWQKGYDIFLKRLPELSKIIPKEERWGIVILGEGPQRPILEKIINEYNILNIRVILPGYRQNAADCISAFDLFIMPSRYEGFGLTLIEAMAIGVPILCSKSDSLPELISSYPNGKASDFNSVKIIDDVNTFISLKKQKSYFQHSIENMTYNYKKLYY